MSAIIFGLMTLLLILVSGFLVLIILMQRASSNSGMGSALGGGAAESALGAGAGNVLTKGTIIGSVAFFVLSFGLYLGLLAQADDRGPTNTLPVESEMAPAEGEAATEGQQMNLPEGLDFSAIKKELEAQGATTTTVNSEQGTMIVTEDAVQVNPAEDGEAAPAEGESTEAPAAEAAPESSETTPSAETKAE